MTSLCPRRVRFRLGDPFFLGNFHPFRAYIIESIQEVIRNWSWNKKKKVRNGKKADGYSNVEMKFFFTSIEFCSSVSEGEG